MKSIFKLIFLVFVFSQFSFAEDAASNNLKLQSALDQIKSQVEGSKATVDGLQVIYDAALKEGDATKIASAKRVLDEAKQYNNSLNKELYDLQQLLNSLNGRDPDTLNTQRVDAVPEAISISELLLPGWNAFAIPINKVILASDPSLGKHDAIWRFDSEDNGWVKDITTLYPGKGYFIRIKEGGTRVKFQGLSFSTNLESVVKKDKTWYFLGASSKITLSM